MITISICSTFLYFTLVVIMSSPKLLFSELPVGANARVVSFANLDKGYCHRLMSLGLTPGTQFEVKQIAPLGDPVQIRVRGFYLSLRWQEAGEIEVVKV